MEKTILGNKESKEKINKINLLTEGLPEQEQRLRVGSIRTLWTMLL
jgi:hypothetical protein